MEQQRELLSAPDSTEDIYESLQTLSHLHEK